MPKPTEGPNLDTGYRVVWKWEVYEDEEPGQPPKAAKLVTLQIKRQPFEHRGRVGLRRIETQG